MAKRPDQITITISGAQGCGKSMLAVEIAAWLRKRGAADRLPVVLADDGPTAGDVESARVLIRTRASR